MQSSPRSRKKRRGPGPSSRKRQSPAFGRSYRPHSNIVPYTDAFGGTPISPHTLPFVTNPPMIRLPFPLKDGTPPWILLKTMLGTTQFGDSALLELRLAPKVAKEVVELCEGEIDVPPGFLHVSIGKLIVTSSKDVRKACAIIRQMVRTWKDKQPFAGYLFGTHDPVKFTHDKRMIIAPVREMDTSAYRAIIFRLKRFGLHIKDPIRHPHVTLCKFRGMSTQERSKESLQQFSILTDLLSSANKTLPIYFHSLCITTPSQKSSVLTKNEDFPVRWRLGGRDLPVLQGPKKIKNTRHTFNQPCKYFLRPSGCSRGDRCLFIH